VKTNSGGRTAATVAAQRQRVASAIGINLSVAPLLWVVARWLGRVWQRDHACRIRTGRMISGPSTTTSARFLCCNVGSTKALTCRNAQNLLPHKMVMPAADGALAGRCESLPQGLVALHHQHHQPQRQRFTSQNRHGGPVASTARTGSVLLSRGLVMGVLAVPPRMSITAGT